MSKVLYSDKYEVQELIAQGGMGVVYKALDRKLNRTVALKVVHPHLSGDSSFLQRFLREARSMAQLQHENIVSIYAVEQDEGLQYLVMEYFPGTNLREELTRQGSFPLLQAVTIARQLANALAYAHSREIIHRDVKPANVLLGEKNKAKLTDFGIAAALNEAPLTSTGQLVGTLQYMSPEQARDATLDGRSDLYSLGLLFYEMLCGSNPRKNLSNNAILGLLASGKSDSLQFPTSVPPQIQDVINQLLQYRPEDRIQDADGLLNRLETLRPVWNPDQPSRRTDTEPTIVAAPGQISTGDDKTVASLSSLSSSNTSSKDTSKQSLGSNKNLAFAGSVAVLVVVVAYGGWYLAGDTVTISPPVAKSPSDSSQTDITGKNARPKQAEAQTPPSMAQASRSDPAGSGTSSRQAETQTALSAAKAPRADRPAMDRPTNQAQPNTLLPAANSPRSNSPTKNGPSEQKEANVSPPAAKTLPPDTPATDRPSKQAETQTAPSAAKAPRADRLAMDRPAKQAQPNTLLPAANSPRSDVARSGTPSSEAESPTLPPTAKSPARDSTESGRSSQEAQPKDPPPLANATLPNTDGRNIPSSVQESRPATDLPSVGRDTVEVARLSAPDIALNQLIDKLRDSLMRRDLSEVQRISVMSERRQYMLRELFRNYASIRVEIRPTDIISTTTGAKFILQFTEVTSLSGETQMLPNAVRKAQMAVDRNGSEWGQIIWDPHLQ